MFIEMCKLPLGGIKVDIFMRSGICYNWIFIMYIPLSDLKVYWRRLLFPSCSYASVDGWYTTNMLLLVVIVLLSSK